MHAYTQLDFSNSVSRAHSPGWCHLHWGWVFPHWVRQAGQPPTNIPTDQPELADASWRLSSHMTLGCVRTAMKDDHHMRCLPQFLPTVVSHWTWDFRPVNPRDPLVSFLNGCWILKLGLGVFMASILQIRQCPQFCCLLLLFWDRISCNPS